MLKGPAASLEKLVEAVRASSVTSASADAVGGALRPIKNEPQEGTQPGCKKQKQHQQTLRQEPPPKKKRLHNPSIKNEQEVIADVTKPQKTSVRAGGQSATLVAAASTQKQKLTKQKLRKRGKDAKKTNSP